jgi:hemerythrin
MIPVQWTPEMSLGIPEIDEQHKKLFATMLSLQNAISADRAAEVLSAIFNELYDYTNTHFTLEESYFLEFDYDQTATHTAAHRYFSAELDAKFKRIGDDPHSVSVDLISFLENWLANHIMIMDKRYESFFKEHGVGQGLPPLGSL